VNIFVVSRGRLDLCISSY